ncbi:MAG: RNA polymerase Rpb4 family protein [Candidatus Micrarchaeota archaeon]
MLGKKHENLRPVTLAEVKKVLSERSKEPDFGYEQQTCLDYATKFCKLKEEDAKQLEKEISEFEELTPQAVVKIVDILPLHKSTLRVILAKDKITIDDEKFEKILKLVLKAKEKQITPPTPKKEGKEKEEGEEEKAEKKAESAGKEPEDEGDDGKKKKAEEKEKSDAGAKRKKQKLQRKKPEAPG